MASALDLESVLKCSICFETFKTPRKLPGCLHSFCENCVLTLVLNLKKENKLGPSFECPVCRLPSTSPENEDVTLDWVRTMETDTDLLSKLKETVIDDASKVCSQCEFVDRSTPSTKYCLTCREYFCKDCADKLHAFRLARNHTLLDISVIKTDRLHSLSLNLLKKSLACSVHPDKNIEFYCEESNELLCILCTSGGDKNWGKLKQISDMIEHSPESEPTRLLEPVSKLKEHVKEIVNIIKEDDINMKNDMDELQLDFQNVKEKLIRLFDAVEDNLKHEGNAAVKERSIENLDNIRELQELNNTLSMLQYLIENILNKCSSEQGFICNHALTNELHRIQEELIKKWSTRKTLKFEFRKEDILNTLQNLGPNETSRLASISQTETVVDLPKCCSKRSLENYTIKKTDERRMLPKDRPGNEESPTYNGLVFLPNNAMLLTDSYYGFCCLVDENKQPLVSHSIPDTSGTKGRGNFKNLRYSTYVRDDTIAMSVPTQKKICFMTTDGQFTSKGEIICVHTPTAIYGLHNDNIAVSWDDPVAFGIISSRMLPYSEEVYFTHDKSGRQLKSFNYITVDKERRHVIQPCNIDKAVYCFKFDGQPVFKYTSTELRDPRGVDVDGNGYIYICDMGGDCIHIVCPEGQVARIVKEGCPKEPLAIGFNKDKQKFAVTQGRRDWTLVHFFSLVANNVQSK